MSMFRKILGYIFKRLNFLFPDEIYLKILYFIYMGKKLDLKNPKRYSEKLMWLKLNDRDPLNITLVDKYAVKGYVSRIIGEEHVIPTLGVWERSEDIDFDALPEQFVLKATNGAGNKGIAICRDKSGFDRESAMSALNKALKSDVTYKRYKEWPYKDVPKRIIAEKYMSDESGELTDYKFFCFDGTPKAMFVATDRQTVGEEVKFDFYDMDFNHLPLKQGHPNARQLIHKPKSFEKMKEIAEKLSKNIPHVRVDLYEINGQVYFGELTFYHFGGLVPFEPDEWDYKFGEWLKLTVK